MVTNSAVSYKVCLFVDFLFLLWNHYDMVDFLCERTAGAPENTAEIIAAHRGVFSISSLRNLKRSGVDTILFSLLKCLLLWLSIVI